MNKPGTEIVPMQFYRDEKMTNLSNVIDLTMVFNRHAYSEDAEKTVEVIEPDSVVFIEGFTLQEASQMRYKVDLDVLMRLRLMYGKNDPDYVTVKQFILEDIRQTSMIPRRSSNDFAQNIDREIQLLLEKDCIVQFADYQKFKTDQSGLEEQDAMVARANIEGARSNPMLQQEQNLSPAKLIRSLYRKTKAEFKSNYMRETYAYGLMAFFFDTEASRLEGDKDINRTKKGKIKTYLTYGTAHANSLSTLFTINSIPSESIVLGNISQQTYIEKTPEDFRDNIARRVAMTAMNALYVDLQPDLLNYGADNVEQAKIYEQLAGLNGDPEAVTKFLIRCIQIRRQLDQDPDRARDWFLGLQEDILRNQL